MPEYKQYIRCHMVKAAPMTRGNSNALRGKETPANENAADEGYHVVYPDGYQSWCPKAQFEEAGRPVDGMTFGQAIELMKRGKKVARRGWNGKGMFLWLKPQVNIRADWCKDEKLKSLVEENGGEILGLGTVCMYTHDSTGRKAILTGWLASQSDMLYEDWCVVE